MGLRAIHNQNEPMGQVLQEIRHEAFHLGSTDIVRVEGKVQAQPPTLRRNRNGRNRRDAIVAVPAILNRRAALGSPSPTDHRLEQEAALVQESKATAASSSVFLCAASPVDARKRWPLRRVRGPDAPVSGNSSPSRAARARLPRDRNGRRNASRSLRRSVSASIDRSDTHGPEGLSGAVVRAFDVGTPSAWAWDPDAAWPSNLWGQHVDRLSSIERLLSVKRPTAWPPRRADDRLRAERRPGIVAARVLRVFLEFSCMRVSTKQDYSV